MKKTCLNPKCGKEFTPINSKGVYCSTKCKTQHHYLLKKVAANQQEEEDLPNFASDVSFEAISKLSLQKPASKLEEIEDLKIENQKLRMKLLEAQQTIRDLQLRITSKSHTTVQNLTVERPKSNFSINTKKDNYDPFKNPLFNSKNKTKTTD